MSCNIEYIGSTNYGILEWINSGIDNGKIFKVLNNIFRLRYSNQHCLKNFMILFNSLEGHATLLLLLKQSNQ